MPYFLESQSSDNNTFPIRIIAGEMYMGSGSIVPNQMGHVSIQNGKPRLEKFSDFKNGIIKHYDCGRLNNHEEFIRGKLFIEPAVQTDDGHFEFWENGRLHNTKGPAIISEYGEIEEYWLNNTPFTKEEWEGKVGAPINTFGIP